MLVSLGEMVVIEIFLVDKDKKIWFRIELDVRLIGMRDVQFLYSLDGDEFMYFGDIYKLYDGWVFFFVYCYGIFNFVIKGLGGLIRVGFLMVEGNL